MLWCTYHKSTDLLKNWGMSLVGVILVFFPDQDFSYRCVSSMKLATFCFLRVFVFFLNILKSFFLALGSLFIFEILI
jgi:hypothetical protein